MQIIRGHPDWRLSNRQHHESYERETALLEELPLVGRMHLLDALPNALVQHAHPGIYEAHYVLGGSMGFRARGRELEVNPGMIFLTPPGEVHSGVDSTLQPAEWYWIHLHIPTSGALPGMTARQTRQIQEAYARTSLCLFPGSDALRDAFSRLLDEHRSPGEHALVIARGILHELMVLLVRDHDRALSNSTNASASPEVRQALEWLDQNIGHPLSIPELAAASGLSQSHFRERFHRETGFTPSEDLTRRRIQHAKQMLQGKRYQITEIAFRLGVQSSPYFAAVFRKITGMTPSEYRDHVQTGTDQP